MPQNVPLIFLSHKCLSTHGWQHPCIKVRRRCLSPLRSCHVSRKYQCLSNSISFVDVTSGTRCI
ncbi:hypothetical protein HanIR_Chr16g0830581 [Helianthus annuus]|nr:hypothetical protein HanIR_Chr16g0830581 [Helianthus annuus]